jgi:hypothetical protein
MIDNGGDGRRRVTEVDVAIPHAVYTSVQILEKHPKTCHFVPLFGAQVVNARCHTSWHEKPRKWHGHGPLIVHYLSLLTLAPRPHELVLLADPIPAPRSCGFFHQPMAQRSVP